MKSKPGLKPQRSQKKAEARMAKDPYAALALSWQLFSRRMAAIERRLAVHTRR